MKKQTTILAVIFVLISGMAEAQVYGGGGVYIQRGYRRPPPRPMQRYPRYPRQRQQTYHPTVNLSFGYGYPNLDKSYFPDQFNGAINAYKGTQYTQTGPITGALDFQFSRYNSIGVMGTYGKVSVPYYDFTAIGINTRTENYTDPDGSKALIGGSDLTDLAYQVSIGARFNMSPNAGFFLEAGYGRYIASGGLTFRF